MKRFTRITLAALALATLATAASAQSAGQWCTKIGFELGQPNPNVCFDIGVKGPVPSAPAQAAAASALQQANAHANAGDARTLQQAQAHADQGDARTLDAAEQHTSALLAGLQKEAFAGIAQAAALVPLAPAADGETTLNIGAASYGGQGAVGLAIARQIGRTTVNAGIGSAGGKRHLVRVGLGWRF